MQININNVKRRKPQADITNSEKWVRNKNEMNAGPQLMHVMVCVWVSVRPGCTSVCAYACVHLSPCTNMHVHGEISMFVCSSLLQILFPRPHLFPLSGSWVWLAGRECKVCLLENIFAFFQKAKYVYWKIFSLFFIFCSGKINSTIGK